MALEIKRGLILGIFGTSFIIFSGTPVQSSGIKSDNVFKDWSVHIAGQKKKRICYIHGKPRKSAGKYKVRGRGLYISPQTSVVCHGYNKFVFSFDPLYEPTSP